MEATKKKFPLNIFEVILLMILLPFTFYFLIKLLGEPINKHAPNWFFHFWGVLLILGLDSFWFMLIKLCPLKMLRLKIYMYVVKLVV